MKRTPIKELLTESANRIDDWLCDPEPVDEPELHGINQHDLMDIRDLIKRFINRLGGE